MGLGRVLAPAKMAAPMASSMRRLWRLGSGVRSTLQPLPGLTQVRWNRYDIDYKEPQLNKDYYLKPLEKLTEEEKFERDLRTTQIFKAPPPSKTSSLFEDPVISKFINMMMKGGNKVLARSLMTETLELLKRKQFQKYHEAPVEQRESIECNPYTIFHQALHNCQPVLGLVSILKSGRFYQVPAPLTDKRRSFLAMKWMIQECRAKKPRRMLMPEKLSHELLEAFYNQGPVIKKKHELHKMAEANRAFAHYRWW
ncbi:28S ribosomal protein S7, mitochondrial [Antechinus flavipes]|uniref:28S ribosomal protein S7, mitochondrial n=1 Tax=Antechinus flavipes TaxID=38775 RepID=UPI0022355C95|nr:28S ribosomal protein S7, mitochondrial [Antechinus flavipes]XP_051851076.1 28S ribosomal protein S7, mitochondrial [Antechinus flavipes]XP_051851077.1 28S ribosomal protein S7, mitochondrial [Antechinus flavipes]